MKEVRLQEKTIERVAGRVAGDLNYFVLHHAVIGTERPPRETGSESTNDRGPRSPGGFSMTRDGGFSMTHEVGQNATIFPDDVGVLVPAESLLSE